VGHDTEKRITIRIPADIAQQLSEQAEQAGRSLHGQIIHTLRRGVAPEAHHGPVSVRIFGRLLEDTARALASLNQVTAAARPGRRVYEGMRVTQPGENIPARVTVDGEPFAQLYQQAFGYDLPDVEWGYLGASPFALARAILVYEYDPDIGTHYAHIFMRDVVALLPRERGGVEWSLDAEQIHLWFTLVKLIEQCTPEEERQEMRTTVYAADRP
jgi:hypothetical protein